MAKIIWSPQSLNDLESILEYIAEDSPFYAASLVENIIKKVEHLALFPKIGREVPEYGQTNIREVFYKQYRIIYELSENSVEILTIFHSSRLLKRDRN